jgi:3D (Asp-Asp-Asp) domain-containing protein
MRGSASGSAILTVMMALGGCHRSSPDSASRGPLPSAGDSAPVAAPLPPERSLEVTATAYNALRSQTDARPYHAAWGDSLVPGIRSIAVSRDLLAMGLKPGMLVSIDSLAGRYIILDKMDARWTKRIDIFFDKDVKDAREWGERRMVIRWRDTTDARALVR